jgi:hypothetical protein
MMMSNLIVPINMAAVSYKIAPDASESGSLFWVDLGPPIVIY